MSSTFSKISTVFFGAILSVSASHAVANAVPIVPFPPAAAAIASAVPIVPFPPAAAAIAS